MTATAPGSGYVGRELELERLNRRLEDAADGHGGFVVVRGPSGMGATRTAYEVAARADRLGMVTLWGTTLDGLAGRPFGAVAEALEELGTSLAPAELRAQLGAGAPALSRMCPRLREILPDIPPAAPLDASDERLRLYDAVVEWLRHASAGRPLLVVLDDIGWADEDTVGLLRHVRPTAGGMPLLILGTDSGTEFDVADEVVELGGLDEGALGAVLVELAQRPLPPSALAAIHEVSGGHPIFARELYRHLAEEDLLVAGRIPAATELPETLEAVMSWRLARLPLETRNVLGALACFPLGVAAALLAQVAGMPRARLVEVMERAVAADIVRLTEQGRRYAIYHDRIRQVLAAGTAGRVRSAVHRRAAETLEAEYGEDARAHAAELVDHQLRSSTTGGAGTVDARAVRHVLVVAEQARSAGAHRRAAACLAFAVKAFGEGERTDYVDLVARRAMAEAEAGMPEAAIRSVRELLGGQRRHGSLTREAWDDVVRTIRSLRHDRGIYAAAALARAALDEGAPRDELLRARLRLQTEEWAETGASEFRWLQWRADETKAAETLAERGDEADKADLLVPQRLRERGDSLRLTGEMTRWHRPPSVLQGMRGATTDLLLRFGHVRDGAALAGRYLASAERFGSLHDVASALLLLARARATLGDLSTADEILAAADDVLARIPGPGELEKERLLAELALAHYRDGDWEALSGRLAALRAGPPQPAGLLLGAEQALAEARAGRAAEARTLIEPLLETLADVPPLTFARDAALFGALTAAWEVGSAEHAVAGRVLVERAAAAGAGGSHAATPRLALARLHGLAGNVAEASGLFAGERAQLQAAGLRPLRAILDYDEAVTIAAASAGFDEAGALLEQAFRQFHGLGMLGWARRAEALQATGFESALAVGGRLHFSYPAGLSRREADVVRLLTAGQTPADAAIELGVDEPVFSGYLSSALEKLGAATLDELPRFARRHGLSGA